MSSRKTTLRKRFRRKIQMGLVVVFGPTLFRLLSWTWKVKRVGVAHSLESEQKLTYAVWHEHIPAGVSLHRACGMCVMISHHHDGELIQRVAQRFGYLTARGSSTRGGFGAIRKMLRDSAVARGLVITPDGPQGPRRSVAPGLLYVAAATRRPMVTINFAVSSSWRVKKSWDKMVFPKPFARVVIAYGHPFDVPRNVLDEDQLTDVAVDDLKESFRRGEAEAEQVLAQWQAGEAP